MYYHPPVKPSHMHPKLTYSPVSLFKHPRHLTRPYPRMLPRKVCFVLLTPTQITHNLVSKVDCFCTCFYTIHSTCYHFFCHNNPLGNTSAISISNNTRGSHGITHG